MALSPDSLSLTLDAWRERYGVPGQVLVGFSGGPDSTVLLHLLHRLGVDGLVAAHVHHGLHPDADRWLAHCRAVAEALGVAFVSRRVEVATRGGDGLEANARAARYAALAGWMNAGDWLMTAHHRDDQAETLLLNLMRGSGPSGLRGIAPARRFGQGTLVRPLLDVDSASIRAYAAAEGLDCIEDPGNDDLRQDRNFLRAEVLPLLEQRWPAVSRQLARSAALARDTAAQLDEQADRDIRYCGAAARLSLARMDELSRSRQLNLLRRAARELGLPAPPARQLAAMLDDLKPARVDAAPCVAWTGGEARRYRDELYLMATLPAIPVEPAERLCPDRPVELPAGIGQLALVAGSGSLSAAVAERGLRIAFRDGGESFEPAGRGGRRKLKKLLQEAGIVPWMRERLPILYAGDELVAVADLWVAQPHCESGGYAVRWQGRPALY